MSSSANLISQFEIARRSWQELNPDQSDPFFWEVSFSPNEADFSNARFVVAEAIEHRSSCSPQFAILVLLYLLRTQLSSVGISRLWPEVARALSHDNLTVDPSRCGNFFRDMLKQLRDAQFPWVHNRYVAWCLDQTAVGSNRTEVVAGFLAFLLDSVLQDHAPGPSGIVSSMLVERYLAKQGRGEEIEVYRSHLQRTGRIIVELVRELRTGEVFHELGFWNWSRLRDWWLSQTGEDLNRLTPETQQVLGTLLSGWGDRVSRSSLDRFVARSGISFEGPCADGILPGNDPKGPALGPICLGTGRNARIVQLCEELGLTSNDILKYKADCWHLIGRDGALAWSEDQFIVQWPDGNRDSSRPFFVGTTLADAQFKGTYVSFRAGRGILPQVVDKTFDSHVPPRLNVRCQWVLNSNGFRLHVMGFTAEFTPSDANLQISIDGRVRWTGSLAESPNVQLGRSIIINPSHDADPVFKLVNAKGHVLCWTTVPRPWNSEAFLAISGRVQKKPTIGFTRTSDEASAIFPSGIVVGVTTKQTPLVVGGIVELIKERFPIPGIHFYRIRHADSNFGQIQIKVGIHYWDIVDNSPVEFLERKTEMFLDSGIEVVTTEAINPASVDDPLLLRMPQIWLKSLGSGRSEFRLVVNAANERLRWTAAEVNRSAHSDQIGVFSLKELAADTSVELPCGLLRIHVERPCVGSSEPIFVFRCPEVIEPLRGGIGENARLELRSDKEPHCVVRSHRPVVLEDVQQGSRVEGWLNCGLDGAVGFRWSPCVADAILFCGDQRVAVDQSLTLEDLDKQLELLVLGKAGEQWTAAAGQARCKLLAGQRIDVGPLLAEAAAVDAGKNRHLTITASAQKDLADTCQMREWQYDQSPVGLRLDAKWLASGKGWHIDLKLECLGFRGFTYEGVFQNQHGISLAFTEIRPSSVGGENDKSAVPQVWKHRITLEPSLILSLNPSQPGSFLFRFGEQIIQQFALPAIPQEIALNRPRIDVKFSIRQIIGQLGAPPEGDDERLSRIVYLCELYVRETATIPFMNIDGLFGKIASYGTKICQRQATASLRFLKILTRSPVEQLFDIPLTDQGPLQLMLASLAAVHQSRLFHIGLADPGRVDELIKLFECISAHDDSERNRCWAVLMTAYADRMRSASNSTLADHLDSDTVESGTREPLVGFDADLNDWLIQIKTKG